jgi:hypothetical protein
MAAVQNGVLGLDYQLQGLVLLHHLVLLAVPARYLMVESLDQVDPLG